MMSRLKKFLALGCSMTLIVSALSGCAASGTGDSQDVNDSGSGEVEAIQSALDEFEGVSDIVRHSDTSGKEETVYAILDANGNSVQTIVSEWLKNPEGATTIKDNTSLTGITVVKGDAEFQKDESGSENSVVWTNDGSDVYYQGTSSKELPVTVNISYELDGKAVTAEELDGASGHLKITFTYNNNTGKETVVQGQKCTIYQPFVMISGMVLDNTKVKNVTVDNGSAINSGDDTMVFGIAMPGLKESLGIDEVKDSDGNKIDIDIPEEVCVEADVTDFSLMMTLTIASNNALSQLGLDDIDSIDDLREDMNKLTDGMNDIIDGSTQLNDGAGELKNGTGELSDGVSRLSDGATELSDGAHKVSDGAAQVNEGAVALKNGLESLKGSAPALASGIGALTQGADQLASGIETIMGNNDALNAGAAQVADNLAVLNASLNNEESKQKLANLVSGSQAFTQGLTETSDSLDKMVAGYGYTEGDLADIIAGLSQYSQELKETGEEDKVAMAGDIQKLIGTYQSLYNDVTDVNTGVSELSAAYGQIDAGIGTTAGSVSTVSQAVSQLSAGASQVKDGVAAYTAGISQASDGVKTLDAGLNSLNAQVPTLVGGIDKLSDGANSLATGTGSLSDGASSLASGADKLTSGTGDLKSGVSRLLDGVDELLDGTGELKDGVIKFNNEGIQKLSDVVNNDLEKYYDRLKAVKDYAGEYTSYAGCEEGVECSVKFIYKTDSIGK